MRQTYFKLFFLFWVLLTSACDNSQPKLPRPEENIFLQGADISFLPEIRNSGVKTYSDGQEEDMLETLKKAGVNVIRLRLWKDPLNETSSLKTVKSLSNEAKALGFKTLISLHYSDTWADPGKQTKPEIWKNVMATSLRDSVYIYTKKIMEALRPDYLQIGNEINGGLLWPDGDYKHFDEAITLIAQTAKAIRSVDPETKIILHYAGFEYANAFFSKFATIDYDIIGLSYYPIWHGKDLPKLTSELSSLSLIYNKSIMIVETAYPWTLSWNDWTNNIVGLSSQLLPEYPASPEGQKAYLMKIKDILKNTPKGLGFCYWGGEWISYKGNQARDGSSFENQAFWDFENKRLPVLDAY